MDKMINPEHTDLISLQLGTELKNELVPHSQYDPSSETLTGFKFYEQDMNPYVEVP